MGELYIWYSEERAGRDGSPPRPLLAVPNVTAHPSTASVLVTVLLYSGCCGVKSSNVKRFHQQFQLAYNYTNFA